VLLSCWCLFLSVGAVSLRSWLERSVGVRIGFADCDMGRLSEYGYVMPLTTSHLGMSSRLHVSSPHSRLM